MIEKQLVAKYDELRGAYNVSINNAKVAWVPAGVDKHDDRNWYDYVPNIKADSPEDAIKKVIFLMLQEEWFIVDDPLWAWR